MGPESTRIRGRHEGQSEAQNRKETDQGQPDSGGHSEVRFLRLWRHDDGNGRLS
jgi:hypothetical protein